MTSSRPGHGVEILAAAALASLILLWLSLRLRRRQRLIRDLPNSKVQGVFIGLVELKVTAESEKPLTSHLSAQSCVQYAFRIEEHWSRTVTESYTDDKGQSQTRTRVEEGWTTVASGGAGEPFYGRDETGVILIRPDGAEVEPSLFFESMTTRTDPLYYGMGPATTVPNSTGRRRFVEEGVPLHAPLFVVGQAREREDVVAAEIAGAKGAALFLISTRSQERIQGSYALFSWLAWLAGLAAAAAAGYLWGVGTQQQGPRPVAAGLALGTGFLAAWGAGWAWMVFNSLVALRARVRQGWSLVEIELKRRNDLIPSLVSAVAALSSHEEGVQRAVAALRGQMEATRPGQPGPDFAGMAGTVRAVAETYPNLVAQEGFGRLQKQLVETEQRIALARSYYNDIATHFATRAAQIPDAWLAAIGGIKPEALMGASDFERAPVRVNLTGVSTAVS